MVITGAAGGIGSALVETCLAAGYTVVAVLREGSSAPIHFPNSPSLMFEYADISERHQVQSLSTRLSHKYPAITWLIHCAGHIAQEDEMRTIDESFAVNIFAPIILSLSLKDSIVSGGGILFVSSTAGLWGSDKAPIYAASKSSLHGFSLSMQKILGDGRRSIVVAPGPTNTPMRELFAHDADKHQSARTVSELILNDILETGGTHDQDIYVIRNGEISRIQIEPVSAIAPN